MFKKKDKNRVKVEFTITLICLKEFPKAEIGSECYVELKRGKKIENCPISKILATKESTVQFDEKFKINCSFHQNSSTNKFDKKELLITAKRNTSKKKDKKWSTLGKNVIDLSNYAEAGTIRHEILTLINKDDKKDKKTRPVTVTLKIETNWLKVNDQKLTKVPTPNPEKKEEKKEDKKEEKSLTKENLDKQTVSLGGNTFVVEQDEVTESVASFSDGEEKINFSDSESEEEPPPKPVKKEVVVAPPPKKETPKPKVVVESDFSEDEDPFDDHNDNSNAGSSAIPESVLAELEDLKSDKLRLERKVEKLNKDLEEKKKEIESLKSAPKPIQSEPVKSTTTTSSVDKSAPDPRVTELRTKLEAEIKEKSALAAEIAVMKQKLKETETRRERIPAKKGTRANEVEMELEDARESENKARADLEKLQKKYKSLQRDLEERKIIESSIYLAETQYNETSEMPLATKILIEKLFAVSAFEPVNEGFLGSVLVSIRKTFSRSSHDTDSMCFWFSYSVSLFKQLKEEVGEQMMSFDDKIIITCPTDENVDSMKPGPKFFYQLGGVIYDAYEKLLSAIHHPMDHLLTSYILEQNENLFDNTQLRNRRKYNNDFPILLLDAVKLLKSHYISDRVTQAILDQIFYYIDCQIFNIFLRQPQLFTASRGFKIKMAISQIESSLSKHSAAFANKQFNYIKEAANLLVMDKSLMSDTSLIQQIFSHLNYLQVKHIVERFKPDELSPDRTPENVKQTLRDLCLKKENSKLSLDLDANMIKPINLLL